MVRRQATALLEIAWNLPCYRSEMPVASESSGEAPGAGGPDWEPLSGVQLSGGECGLSGTALSRAGASQLNCLGSHTFWCVAADDLL